MKINARTKSIMVAVFLLAAISLAYRYTERYEYGKKEEKGVLKEDPEVAKMVKERNITQADLDEIMKVIT
jgi:regulatory protein YycI of two-component signal transduction system YycFG|tara:strand:+ start:252 stop:461 length:210 start_codon:yes stop_codon:yes gene_type:complete